MIAALLAKDTPNTTGLPPEWPVESRAVMDASEVDPPWVVFTEEAYAAHLATHAAAKEAWNQASVVQPVPEEVPTWALREVCAQSTVRSPNLKAVIDAAIASLPEPDKSIAAGRWNFKPTIRRNDALTLQLIAGLGLIEAQADDLFRAAAVLN